MGLPPVRQVKGAFVEICLKHKILIDVKRHAMKFIVKFSTWNLNYVIYTKGWSGEP